MSLGILIYLRLPAGHIVRQRRNHRDRTSSWTGHDHYVAQWISCVIL